MTILFSIGAALAIHGSVTNVIAGSSGSFEFSTSGAVGDVSIELTDSDLPAGWEFTDNGDGTGTLTWTQTPAGSYTFTLQAEDEAGQPVFRRFFFDGFEQPGAFDPYFDNVVALLHFNGDATDETGKTWTASGTPVYDASVYKFGEGSLSLDGSSYLDTPAVSDFNLGTNDFTIEAWIRVPVAAGSARRIIGQDAAAALGAWVLLVDGSGYARINVTKAGGLSLETARAPVIVTANTWHHVAAVRVNDELRLYLDGQVGPVEPIASDYYVADSVALPTIGAEEGGGGPFTGYIDELRVTNGVGRYPANFTPPTIQFPSQ